MIAKQREAEGRVVSPPVVKMGDGGVLQVTVQKGAESSVFGVPIACERLYEADTQGSTRMRLG
jgi:hypothetical protein